MSLILRNLLKTNKNFYVLAKRTAAYYNKDWKPGPYPQNAEERIAAAKKYGLRPDDYMPYPDDGLALGDYPYVRPFSLEHRDPWEYYDYFPERINFNETLTLHYDVYREGMLDPDDSEVYRNDLTKSEMLFWFLFPFLVLCGIFYFFEDYKYFHPVMVKQFPYEGKTHYLYEAPDEN